MVELFGLIAEAAPDKRVDLRLIYFELGQLMVHTHRWLITIDKTENEFIEEKFGNYFKLMDKRKKEMNKWTFKTIAYYG